MPFEPDQHEPIMAEVIDVVSPNSLPESSTRSTSTKPEAACESDSNRISLVAENKQSSDPPVGFLLDDKWAGPRWLHPSSLLFEFISGIREQLYPAVIAIFSFASGSLIGFFFAVVFFAISMAIAVFRYLTLRYELTRDELIVDQGIVFKRHRTIPVQRIQNIDSLQNPLHRLFGVAEVRIESASGTEPEAILRVLSLAEVDQLRKQIAMRRTLTANNERGGKLSSQIEPVVPTSTVVVQAAPQHLLEVSTPLLIKAGLISNRGLVVLAFIIGAFYQFGPSRSFRFQVDSDQIAVWVPYLSDTFAVVAYVFGALLALSMALRIFSAGWYVLKFHGYTLERQDDELRVRCGLLTKIAATVPRRRIQFISIHRSWLGKKLGIASIRIETAGGAGKSDESASSVSRRWFIPAIEDADVQRILAELRPGLVWDESRIDWKPLSPRAGARMRRLNLLLSILVCSVLVLFWSWWGILVAAGLLSLGLWRIQKKAAAMRYARGEFGIAYRSGLLIKKCSLTFLDKVQAVSVSHSPFDRSWGMATLELDTASAGPADHRIEVPMLEAAFAKSECAAIAKLASRTQVRFS